MKKLMFVAAAALAGSVFAEGEITSANVVGYQQVDIPNEGVLMSTPTFKPVSGTNYKISDIKVVGEVGGVGMEYGQKLGSDGSWGDTYYVLSDGWYKDDIGIDPVTDDDVLTPGEALLFSAETGFGLQYSGEVNPEATEITIVDGGVWMAGNATPVDVKISDLEVVGEVGGVGMEYGQKVGTDGSWGDTYYILGDGWYKDDIGIDPVTDDDFLAPGESILISAETGFTLKVPSALQ